MTSFDFITHEAFRASLESDYRELQACFKKGAWKSVQVLAGSIVEALLVDYLVAKPDIMPKGKDPLKVELNDAIIICKSAQVLTDRTADLCAVIRSYRNLIHPGRQVRLNESAPSENSARIALALVDLIIEEIARVREGTFGLTAEQILTKLERDSGSLAILPFLLQDVREPETERLLTDVLPPRYEELDLALGDVEYVDDENADTIMKAERLRRGFRMAFERASDPTKARVAARFPQKLRYEEESRIRTYASGLFCVADLKYVSDKDRPLVKEYFLSKMPQYHDSHSVDQMPDLAVFLEASEVRRWLNPFILTLLNAQVNQEEKEAVRKHLMAVVKPDLPGEILASIMQRLDEYIAIMDGRGASAKAASLQQLRMDFVNDIEEMIPF